MITPNQFTSFEKALIEKFILMNPGQKNEIYSQFNHASNIERDFTGMGCFISFNIDPKIIYGASNSPEIAGGQIVIDGPDIFSSQLENGAYTLFFINTERVFNCIEIVGKNGDYPKNELLNYTIKIPEPITIIDLINE